MTEDLQQIIDKVRAMYYKYGIKSVTMDDVARELGISKKTLYQHVSDKNDLVAKVIMHVVETDHGEFEKIFSSEKNAIEELINMTLYINRIMKQHNPATYYDLKKYYPELFKQMMDIRREKMHKQVIHNLRKGKEQGIYRKEMKEAVIAKLTLLRTFQMFENDTIDIYEFTSVDFFTEVLIYHIRGIANTEGLKILEQNIHKLVENTKQE